MEQLLSVSVKFSSRAAFCQPSFITISVSNRIPSISNNTAFIINATSQRVKENRRFSFTLYSDFFKTTFSIRKILKKDKCMTGSVHITITLDFK